MFQLTLFEPDSQVPPSHLKRMNGYALIFVRDELRRTPTTYRRSPANWGLSGDQGLLLLDAGLNGESNGGRHDGYGDRYR